MPTGPTILQHPRGSDPPGSLPLRCAFSNWRKARRSPPRYSIAWPRWLVVTPEQLFETPHRSPEPPLWTWGEDEWLPVLRLPAYAPRKSRPPGAVQPSLFALEEVSA